MPDPNQRCCVARGRLSLAIAAALSLWCATSEAQVRGVYPSGMNATNAGVTPDSGLSYSNLFIFNGRDELRSADGQVTDTGSNAVMLDLSTIVWVSRKEVLGGARLSATGTFILSNSSLTSDTRGQINAGGGFGDFYLQPFILGWQLSHASIRTGYGVLAPTGAFTAGASNNVGSGYWTQAPWAGVTVFLTDDKNTALSAFHMYEFHTVQEGTNIHPGQNGNIDYSLTRTMPVTADTQLQLGLVGYEQWQATDKTGPTITPEQSVAHYRVNALGFATNVLLPPRKVSLGLKYFKEFSNRSTFQGYTLHISGAVTF